MTCRVLPTWRSLLFCPANSERFVGKAHTRGADAVILDLEDSVIEAEKPVARNRLAEAARKVGQSGADVCVRINRPLEHAVQDIVAAVGEGVGVLMLPKVSGPEHVRLLAEVVAGREAALGMRVGHTRFIAVVESAAALAKINEIASAHERLVALSVGSEDFATDLEVEPTSDNLYVAKMLGIYAARAAGILPLGLLGSVANIGSIDEYIELLRRSRDVGFACVACVHPRHVPLVNETFTPHPAEVERARRILAAAEMAGARGEGAFAFEGSMVDRPVVDRALRLVARAKADLS